MRTPLQLSDFHFSLPDSLIAQAPLPERDAAKLLCWKDGEIQHTQVQNLADIVPPSTLFIVNDSRVIASRIRFDLPTGAKGEFLLLEPTEAESPAGTEEWLALGRPMRRFKQDQRLHVGNGLDITITKLPDQNADSGPSPIKIRLSKQGTELLDWLSTYGEMPLPPYIERRNADEATAKSDRIRYQTVYAELAGSVAAPTAGLHFTKAVMQNLKAKGCQFASVTLHVGAGTFLPVKTPHIASHEMHEERFLVPLTTLRAIDQAKSDGRSVVVVGTTALRSLEGLKLHASNSKVDMQELADRWHRTKIFIHPEYADSKYVSWAADALMTNFHQPESTLLMLVSALVGYNNIRRIYQNAIEHQYRFFSYGDSSLLWL